MHTKQRRQGFAELGEIEMAVLLGRRHELGGRLTIDVLDFPVPFSNFGEECVS